MIDSIHNHDHMIDGIFKCLWLSSKVWSITVTPNDPLHHKQRIGSSFLNEWSIFNDWYHTQTTMIATNWLIISSKMVSIYIVTVLLKSSYSYLICNDISWLMAWLLSVITHFLTLLSNDYDCNSIIFIISSKNHEKYLSILYYRKTKNHNYPLVISQISRSVVIKYWLHH